MSPCKRPPLNLHRANKNSSSANRIDVHMTICFVFQQLFGRQRIDVRSADEEGAKIASIV